MTAAFLMLNTAADVHDLLAGLSLNAGPFASCLEFLGWSAYLPLALLIFFPIEKDGRPDWTWLPFLDFLLVTEAAAVAYFRLVYIPHLQSGQPWTILGHPEAVRNILLAAGLLLRSGIDPSSRARAIYLRIGSIFAGVMLLRMILPGYSNPVYALIRPGLWLLLGILAVRWKDTLEAGLQEVRRRGVLRMFLNFSSAATLLVVVVLGWGAPSPVHVTMHVCVGISVALFVMRGLHAERSRYAAETLLRNSEQDYRVLFESAIVPIVILEPVSGRILQANAAACRMYRIPADGLIGANIKDFTKDVTGDEKQMAELLQSGTSRRFESVHRTKDGEDLEVWVSSSVIRYRGQKAILSFHRDITARKKAEELFAKAFGAIPAPVTISSSSDGSYIDVNEAFLRATGYTRDEVIGRTAIDIRFWETHDLRRRFLEKLKSGSVRDFEVMFSTKTGEARLGLVSGDFIEIAGQQCVLAITTDVTDRKRAEEALHESESRFRSLVENATVGIYRTTPDGRIVMANPALVKMMGCNSSEELAERNLEVRGFDPEYPRAEFKKRLHTEGEVLEFESAWKRRDGSTLFVKESAHAIPGSGGQIAYYDGIVEDITGQKRAQESLLRLRHAVDASGEVIFMTDREGVITFVNPEFTRLYGYTAEEVVGKATPRILKSGTRGLDDYRRFWAAILNRQVTRGNLVNKNKEGSLVAVESSANPILDDDGEVIGFLAIQRDITARKQLEEQLRQAQKMEAIGRLAGGVAHDFNNLLTIINGYAQLLQERFTEDERAHAQLGEILKAGDRATALTRQLLAFSRRQVLEPKDLNLASIVEGMQTMLQRIIGEDIELKIFLHQPLGLIKADPTLVEQAIMNLAVNARDAMPHGGKLTIETAVRELDATYAVSHSDVSPGNYVMLAVIDSGIGMDDQTLAHVFEPFFTTKARGKGTGLGLSTVYGIVKQNRGHISVYSEPGHGSIFKLYFPQIAASAEDSPTSEIRSKPGGGSETILVVEDEDAVRELAVGILQGYGYKVLESATPQEAVRIGEDRQTCIDLILTDVVMPGMSGRNAAEHLAFLRPEMKVLYMSGYTDDAILHHGVLQAEVAFVQKPFTPEALARKVREVLDAPHGPARQAA